MTTISGLGEFETPGDAARAIWLAVAAACGNFVVLGGRRLAGDRPSFDVTFRDDRGRALGVTVTIEELAEAGKSTVAVEAPDRNPDEPRTTGDAPRIWSGTKRYPGTGAGRSPSKGSRCRERGNPLGSAGLAREARRPWRSPE